MIQMCKHGGKHSNSKKHSLVSAVEVILRIKEGVSNWKSVHCCSFLSHIGFLPLSLAQADICLIFWNQINSNDSYSRTIFNHLTFFYLFLFSAFLMLFCISKYSDLSPFISSTAVIKLLTCWLLLLKVAIIWFSLDTDTDWSWASWETSWSAFTVQTSVSISSFYGNIISINRYTSFSDLAS